MGEEVKAVREVLKQNKIPAGHPPTMADVKTREKHVPESVDYNIKHFADHGSNVGEQLKKLHQVNPGQAHSYADKSLSAIKKVHGDIEAHTKGKCKECNK